MWILEVHWIFELDLNPAVGWIPCKGHGSPRCQPTPKMAEKATRAWPNRPSPAAKVARPAWLRGSGTNAQAQSPCVVHQCRRAHQWRLDRLEAVVSAMWAWVGYGRDAGQGFRAGSSPRWRIVDGVVGGGRHGGVLQWWRWCGSRRWCLGGPAAPWVQGGGEAQRKSKEENVGGGAHRGRVRAATAAPNSSLSAADSTGEVDKRHCWSRGRRRCGPS
jgi:hypothetical protein